MPKPLYDNLEDAKTKLAMTLCYHGVRAVQIKDVALDIDGYPTDLLTRPTKGVPSVISMVDPDFNCTEFNIGYVNNDGCATWWCRRPLRQYRQGLRYDQMHEYASQPGYRGRFKFDWGGPVINMMEDRYPDFETCEKQLRDQVVLNIAFHRNFAVSWDNIHEDMIVEYKSQKIGMSHKFKKFKLMEEFKYLNETLTEITHVHG